MDEQKIIDDLTAEGYDKVWVHEAESDEVDPEHEHDYDTTLVILKGDIQIISEMGGAVTNMKYVQGQTVEIPKEQIAFSKGRTEWMSLRGGRKALKLVIDKRDPTEGIELLTIKNVAELLKISQTSVRRLQQGRHIPFIKVGGSVRFAKNDIVKYLERNRIESMH